jgi:hypothetical protein
MRFTSRSFFVPKTFEITLFIKKNSGHTDHQYTRVQTGKFNRLDALDFRRTQGAARLNCRLTISD